MRHLIALLCALLLAEICRAEVWIYQYSCSFEREQVFSPDPPAAVWGGTGRGSHRGFIVSNPADQTRVDYCWFTKQGYRHSETESTPLGWLGTRDDKGQDWLTINLDSFTNAASIPGSTGDRRLMVLRTLQGKVSESVRLDPGRVTVAPRPAAGRSGAGTG